MRQVVSHRDTAVLHLQAGVVAGGGFLGLMLTNVNQLQTCTLWDTASLGLAVPSQCPLV